MKQNSLHPTDALVLRGPTMSVNVGLDTGWKRSGRPNLPNIPIPALVDTGATVSSLDVQLAVRLRLPVVDDV